MGPFDIVDRYHTDVGGWGSLAYMFQKWQCDSSHEGTSLLLTSPVYGDMECDYHGHYHRQYAVQVRSDMLK